MEWRVVVCAGCAEGEEIVGCFRGCRAEEFELEITMGSMQCDGHA